MELRALPEGWEIHRLDAIAVLERGKFSARPRDDPRFFGGRYPFIQTGDVSNSSGSIDRYSQTLNAAGLRVSKLFPSGTLFFTIAANIGDVGISSFATACPDSLVAITPKRWVDKRWLLYALRFRKGQFEGVATQNAQLNINLEKLRPFEIEVASTPEQHRIAAVLTDVDALIGALDSLIAKKRDLKQAAMQHLLTGRPRLPGFADDWASTRLAKLTADGPSNGYSGPTAEAGTGTLSLKLSATSSGRLILREETVKRLKETIPPGSGLFLRSGDVLIQRSNTPEMVGTAAVFEGPADTYVYPDLMMRLRFHEQSIAEWVWRYVNTRRGREYLLGRAAGSSGSMVKISGAALRSMMVPLPSRPERIAIATVLSDMDAEIAALEARRDKTRLLKQGMMQELLTGRVRLL